MGPTGERASETIVIFDFDHTLVSMDSGSALVMRLIFRSPLRVVVAVLLLPLAGPLLLWRRTRLAAISTFLWVATAGAGRSEFDRQTRAFADAVVLDAPNAQVLESVLGAFRAHVAAGHRVVVVSGSFEALVTSIVRRLTVAPVQVVGSSITSFCGGTIGKRHCHGTEKIAMLLAAGVPDRPWQYGYSDSAFDIPLLRRCEQRYLVKPSARTLARYEREFGSDFELMR